MRLRSPPITKDNDLNDWLSDLYQAAVNDIGQVIQSWFRTNIPRNLSSIVLNLLNSSTNSEIVMIVPGDLVGISVASDIPLAAGNISLTATIDGGPQTEVTVSLTTSNPQYNSHLISHSHVSFNTNQRVGIRITTSSDLLPLNMNIICNLYVLF